MRVCLDATILLHVASPIALENHNEDFFVKPAVAGVNRALTFAKKHNIKKVVLTSSVAAIFDSMEKKSYYDESDWSDPENPRNKPLFKKQDFGRTSCMGFCRK